MDEQEFLRVISISDPVPTGLAAALSFREDAGSVLDRLERRTSLVTAVGLQRESYRVQERAPAYVPVSPTCSARGPGGWPGCTLSPLSGGPAGTNRCVPSSTPRTAVTTPW